MGTNATTEAVWPTEAEITDLSTALVDLYDRIEELADRTASLVDDRGPHDQRPTPTIKQAGVIAAIVRTIENEKKNIDYQVERLEALLSLAIEQYTFARRQRA